MSRQAITVELPEEVYEHVKRAALGMKRPLERALASIVKAATPSLEKVPTQYRPELERMEALSDERLWKIAESSTPEKHEITMARLLRKNQGSGLTEHEQQRLAQLCSEVDRLALRKSYAYLLLKYRGHRISSLHEMK
jgi:hypothetical protein